MHQAPLKLEIDSSNFQRSTRHKSVNSKRWQWFMQVISAPLVWIWRHCLYHWQYLHVQAKGIPQITWILNSFVTKQRNTEHLHVIPYNGIFSRFCLKIWGLFFADFNFRGQQCPRKIILILFRENRRVGGGGTTRLSLDRSTVRKENLQTKYLKHNEIEDTCSLTDKQTKPTYLHSDGWIKWLSRRKQWNVCLACLLRCVIWHFFAIKQLVVNINANILFNKETKTITCMSKQQQKKFNQRDTE